MKVVLVAAITADGYIGKDDSDLSTRWTSKEDSMFFRKLSKEIGKLVVGSKTFATFDRKIAGRKFFVYSKKNELENLYDNNFELVSEDPRDLVKRLDESGVESVMVAGGSSIYTQFLKAGVVNEIYLTIEPIIFGNGVKLFNDTIESSLDLIEVINLSTQTKVLHYKVKN